MTAPPEAWLYIIYASGAVAGVYVLTRLYLIKARRAREHTEAWALCEDERDP